MRPEGADGTEGSGALHSRPLYVQVRERLTARLIEGVWQPGQLIPSETELARELAVSQGTVRKALDAMTAENLLVRRQGKGTYVAEPDESRILFQFFRLVPDTGEQAYPGSQVLSVTRARALAAEAADLGIARGDTVWRIERLRTLAGAPLLVETITLPAARFPGFDALPEVPNNVYALYSARWGITIGTATERLKAVPATAQDAAHLGCAEGTPLMSIARVAHDLARAPVELRLSRVLTEGSHYTSTLG